VDAESLWASLGQMSPRRPKSSCEPTPGDVPDPEEPELPFEASLERLESLVEELERGDLELERALAAFEEGVRLSRSLDRQLNRAEQHIEVLLRDGGGFATRPFEPSEDSDA
jgi:exodeoxyribonuclease VII small subunit